MAKPFSARAADVASIANHVLVEWKSGRGSTCSEELERAQQLAGDLRAPDTYEAERAEILIGAIEMLACSRPERVNAALSLLEHLAGTGLRR
jgi:hypothetical protein